MAISLGPEVQRLIEERIKRGGYAGAEEVIRAGLTSLEQQEAAGDFAPGELDRMIADAEAEFERRDRADAEEVFAGIRQLSAEFRKPRTGHDA